MQSDIQKNARAETTRMLFILGILIFTYTLVRAKLLSITWDESQSYHEYIRNHLVFPPRLEFMSANNHILNTFAGIVFTELFGVSEFTLRIPSLIAHAFFLIFSAKLLLNFSNKWLAVSAFLILNINPFLLDFFSLSRGYGISIGMMMVSIFYLHQVLQNDFKRKDILLMLAFGALASLGNLTLLNYFLVSFAVIALMLFFQQRQTSSSFMEAFKSSFRKLLLPGVFFVLFLCFILPVSFDLRAAGAFFFGGDLGLWKDTIGTIVPRLWYEMDFTYWLQRLTKIFFFLIFFSAAVFVFRAALKKELSKNGRFLCSLLMIFFFILLSTVVQHHLLGTLYLIERTVLFLFVLLMLIFVFFLQEFSLGNGNRALILHFSAFLFLLHFLFSFNLKYVYEWKDDCETKEMLADLIQLKEDPDKKFNLSIGLPLSLESSINYYREVNRLTWLNETGRDTKINNLNDYFFIRPQDTLKFNMDSLEVIKRYPLTKNILAKPRYPFAGPVVILDSIQHDYASAKSFRVHDSMEYSPGFSLIIKETSAIKNSLLSCKIQFQPLKEFRANVYYVISCSNKKGIYEWRNLRLNDFCFDEEEPATANFTTFIPQSVKPGDEIKIYLWNPDGQQFLVSKMRLKWLRYFDQ